VPIKFTQIGIFDLRKNHLATLAEIYLQNLDIAGYRFINFGFIAF
jgi:hypothetical protein